MAHRFTRRLAIAVGTATLVASLTAGGALAGEITGNGTLKDIHGRSACTFSGQEDLQWYVDEETNLILVENPVKGVPGHAQSWGQIAKADRDFLTSIGHNPGIACNPTKSAGEE